MFTAKGGYQSATTGALALIPPAASPATAGLGDLRTLDCAPLLQALDVVAVAPPQGAPEWAAWLEAIGFLPGEQVTVLRRGYLGDGALVVRVGDSTFALRCAEAACVTARLRPVGGGGEHA